jgi:hypothetical protein
MSTQDTRRPVTKEADIKDKFDDQIPEERCEPVP